MKAKLSILGLGHTGCVFASAFAKKGFKVTGFDLDKKIVANLNLGKAPIFENGLDQQIKKQLKKNLNFTSNILEALNDSQYLFITEDLKFENNKISYHKFKSLIKLIANSIKNSTILVICSQVQVGQSRQIRQLLTRKNPNIEIIYFQENLRIGQGLKPFLKPDRIVLGSDSKATLNKFKADFSFFKCPVLTMSLESAELSKHALNAYLAMNISFSSEIGDICELVGADLSEVVQSLLTDSRVSNLAPIKPGTGFAGGSLKRDLKHLISISKKHKYHPRQMQSALKVNDTRLDYLYHKIQNILGQVKSKKIGILGLSYKPNSDLNNESLSLKLAAFLKSKKAQVKGFDPRSSQKIRSKDLEICKNLPELFKNLDLAILMTEWPEFKKLKPDKVGQLMKTKIIFDTKNFLNRRIYLKAGFNYYGVGYKK